MSDMKPKEMGERRFVERHLVRLAIEECSKEGLRPYSFDDGEEAIPVNDAETAWAAFNTVDEGTLFFMYDNEDRLAWIRLIGGNGRDVIGDYSASKAMTAAMERVYLY